MTSLIRFNFDLQNHTLMMVKLGKNSAAQLPLAFLFHSEILTNPLLADTICQSPKNIQANYKYDNLSGECIHIDRYVV
ncbi:hypothetical protein CMK12_04665 [Candidatus Poribacteria bacterium]|nr:hypothetical protein [Candidatus Poribacteria bacterium]